MENHSNIPGMPTPWESSLKRKKKITKSHSVAWMVSSGSVVAVELLVDELITGQCEYFSGHVMRYYIHAEQGRFTGQYRSIACNLATLVCGECQKKKKKVPPCHPPSVCTHSVHCFLILFSPYLQLFLSKSGLNLAGKPGRAMRRANVSNVQEQAVQRVLKAMHECSGCPGTA